MSKARYTLRPAASRQLRSYAQHLFDTAGPEVAERFVDQCRSTFAFLAESSGIGALVRSHNPRLMGLRKWRVEGFPSLLIFYVVDAARVRILYLLHAASDWQSLFDAD